MRDYSLSHLSDGALLRRLARLVARDRVTTAMLVAHIAEVDARRLYAPAGYSSMHAYCVGELRLSEDAASRRIQAARAARRVPALFEALFEGRLHLTAACLLAPHITDENADELIQAASHRGKAEIEGMLLRRLLGRSEYALAHVDPDCAAAGGGETRGGPGHPDGASDDNLEVDEHALAHVADQRAMAVTPSPECVSLHVAITRSTQEKLRYAQALLSHAVPSGDPALVLDRALDALIEKLEKRRFGASARASRRPRVAHTGEAGGVTHGRESAHGVEAPRVGGLPSTVGRKRYIPAHVRRAVWERDQGRCTFVGMGGHRCEARRLLEFDHVEPVARGGWATVEGIRLRCRTHNQYEAERVFGAGFMSEKRQRAQLENQIRDVQACLRNLGCRAEEARRTAARAAARGASFEDHLRAALRSLGRRSVTPAP